MINKNKKLFDHSILKKPTLNYIFEKNEQVHAHYSEQPLSSLGILKKKR